MSGHCDRRIFKYSGFLSGAVCDRCASWSDRYYWYSGLPCSNRMLHGSNRKNRPWKTAGAGRTGKICSGICAGHERGWQLQKSAGSDKICDTVDRYPTGNCKGIWRGAGSGKSCILLQWKPGSFQMYPDADRFLYGISGSGKCRKYVRQSADAWGIHAESKFYWWHTDDGYPRQWNPSGRCICGI